MSSKKSTKKIEENQSVNKCKGKISTRSRNVPTLHETKKARQKKSKNQEPDEDQDDEVDRINDEDDDDDDEDDEEPVVKAHPKILTKNKNLPTLKETKLAKVKSLPKGKQVVEDTNDEDDDEDDEDDEESDVNLKTPKNKKQMKSHEMTTTKSILKKSVNLFFKCYKIFFPLFILFLPIIFVLDQT